VLLRISVAALLFLIVAGLYLLWRRPSRRLRGLDLRDLGVRGPVIVQFSTRLCAPCKAAIPRLEEASRESGVPLVQVDVGDRPEIARRYGIRTVPTIVVARRSGDVLGSWAGMPADGEVLEAARSAR